LIVFLARMIANTVLVNRETSEGWIACLISWKPHRYTDIA
jgi:hypothetical protein